MDELKTAKHSNMRAVRHGWQRGQSAVEIAIAAPVLAILLVFCADFGRIFYTNVEVDNAARAGAQYGSQSTTAAANSTNIATAAINGAPNLSLTSAAVSSSVCTCQTPTPSGQTACSSSSSYCTDSPDANYVTVTVTKAFSMTFSFSAFSNLTHGLSSSTPNSWNLSGTAIMQVQE
jgi:Flp pilus assembly protein TadG